MGEVALKCVSSQYIGRPLPVTIPQMLYTRGFQNFSQVGHLADVFWPEYQDRFFKYGRPEECTNVDYFRVKKWEINWLNQDFSSHHPARGRYFGQPCFIIIYRRPVVQDRPCSKVLYYNLRPQLWRDL